jgi:hypothetical protein
MKNNQLLLIVVAGALTMFYFNASPQTPPAPPAHPAGSAATSKAGAAATPAKAGLVLSTTDPVTLTVDPQNADASTVELSVTNSAKDPLKLRHALGDMGLSGANGAIKTPDAISISGAVDQLAGGDSEHLVLRWESKEAVHKGTYQGILTISPDKGDAIHQVVRVVVPDRLAIVQPLVSKLNLKAYRWFPFTDIWSIPCWFPHGLPLKSAIDADRAGLTRIPLLGAVSRDPTGTAAIVWDGKKDTLSGTNPALGLAVQSIPFAGKYDGTLSFGKDAASNVSITVTASDFILWPVVWLVVCVLLAIGSKNWLGEGRQLALLTLRIEKAQLAMQDAVKEFTQTVSEVSRGYSLREAFDAQCQGIQDKMTALGSTLVGTLDTASAAYVALDASITALSALPGQWIAFGQSLNRLREMKEGLDPGSQPPGLDSAPAAFLQTDMLLQPVTLTIDQFAIQKTLVEGQTVFLHSWVALWTATSRIHSGLEDFAEANASNDAFVKVKNQADLVRARVWLLSGKDTAANASAATDVGSSQEQYSALLEEYDGKETRLAESLSLRMNLNMKMLNLNLEKFKAVKSIPAVKPVTEADVRKLNWTVKTTDRNLGILSLILAILTGLNSLYFGKPFGTVADYVALTLWAFGAKIAVDVLSGGLERWVGSKT